MISDERKYAVSVGRISDGSKVVQCLEFETESQASLWAQDVNEFHEGLLCCVLGKDDMEYYMDKLNQDR